MSIVIDGITYNVNVLTLTRSADFLDKYAERLEDGTLKRELIGVYFNYQLTLSPGLDTAAYAALWLKLTEAVEFHTVTVPDESGDYTFTAYFSGVKDELRKQKGAVNFWKNLTVNFIAQSPENVPT